MTTYKVCNHCKSLNIYPAVICMSCGKFINSKDTFTYKKIDSFINNKNK